MNISFEFFPARTEHGEKALNEVQKELSAIKPEFFSVTFGALGSSQDATFETITNLLNNTNIPIAPHLTCVGIKKSQATDLLDKYIELGVNRVMVLKGDPLKFVFHIKIVETKVTFVLQMRWLSLSKSTIKVTFTFK